jgi:uncharacterized membrane protein YsdA (DUF1294 family)
MAVLGCAIGLVYLVASLVTYATYRADKLAAVRRRRRTPERTLHALALAGGWPGAWIAQRRLRHKTAKAGFRAVFWGTVVVNVVALVALCSLILAAVATGTQAH